MHMCQFESLQDRRKRMLEPSLNECIPKWLAPQPQGESDRLPLGRNTGWLGQMQA